MEPEEIRTCSRCGQPLIGDARPSKGLVCVGCRRERGRAHYSANRGYYVAKAQRRSRAVSEATRAWVLDYLRTHPCVDCGTADPRVLEFDHRDPRDKRAHVSWLITCGYSLATVEAEIRKCEVRCANCHRIKTREEFGWWRATETA